MRLFRAAVLVKGLDGAVELVVAIVLLLLPRQAVHRLVADVVTRDLLGPPEGTLARHLVSGTAEFASGRPTFVLAYLALHGVIKLALVVALLRGRRAAFPVAIVVLGIFVGYEVYRAARTGSLLLPFLAALDVAIIVLVWREYRASAHPTAAGRTRSRRSGGPSGARSRRTPHTPGGRHR